MIKEYIFFSERLKYRTINASDSKLISNWRSDWDIIQYYKNPVKVSYEAQIKWYNERYLTDSTRIDFIVSYNDIPIGFVALININDDTAEVSYTIGEKNYKNKRFSKEMIESICCFGSDKLGINSFVAEIHGNNLPSQKAAESAGFGIYKEVGEFYCYIREGCPDVKIYYCNN